MDRDMQAKIVGKASADAEFRARLLGDPKGAIAQLGIAIPASLAVEVHEESDNTAHLILPAAGSLTESEMEAASGGTQGGVGGSGQVGAEKTLKSHLTDRISDV